MKKLDTFIVVSKGFAYLIVGIFSPWIAALGQWANSGEWPSRIVWVGVILPLSAIGGATQWLAFCSSSWKDYKDQRDNGGQPLQPVLQPPLNQPVAPAENKPKET
jgi:hypothetical protein